MFVYLGVAAVFYLFYKWWTADYDYFVKKGVSYNKPTFSSLIALFIAKKSLPEFIEDWYNEFKNEK